MAIPSTSGGYQVGNLYGPHFSFTLPTLSLNTLYPHRAITEWRTYRFSSSDTHYYNLVKKTIQMTSLLRMSRIFSQNTTDANKGMKI